MDNQCFVMMPFGDLFDEYYKDIMVSAIREAGFEPKRADEIYGPGVIISDVLSEIRRSAVLVADVTNKNPNVHYEFGYADAFDLPVIIIAQSKEDIPFDYRHRRLILYNTQKTGWDKKLAKDLVQSLQAVPSRETTLEGGGNVEIIRFFRERPPTTVFLEQLESVEAGGEISLLGIAMTVLEDPRVQKSLEKKLNEGCRIRVLTLYPTSKAVKPTATNEGRTFQEMKNDLTTNDKRICALIKGRLAKAGGRIELGHYSQAPKYYIFMTGAAMIVGFYLCGKRGAFLPHVEIGSKESSAYREFAKHFDSLWERRMDARPIVDLFQ